MYRLYSILKERVNKPVTQEEINIASGKTPLEPGAVTEFIAELENNTENIKRAFAKQKQQALVRELNWS